MPSEPQDTLREVSDGINEAVSIAGMIQDPVGAVTGMLENKANEVLANATNFISQALPSFPAGFLGSLAIGLPHAHVLHPPSGPPPIPPTPLPPIGAVMLGTCVSVLINGIPAARSGDVGFNPTCCGLPPMFDIFTGSSKVFIGGKRAARMVDITVHCKPGEGGAAAAGGGALATLGKIATAASVGADVMDAAEGDPAAAARLAVMAAQAAADAVANALKASMGMDACVPPGTFGMLMLGAPNVLIGGFPMPSWSAIAKGFQKLLKGLRSRRRPSNNGCGRPGEPVDVVTGANVDDFIDYQASALPGVQWSRYYSSSYCNVAGPIGLGFRHEYQRELYRDIDGFRYVNQEGEVIEFPPVSEEQVAAREGYKLRQIGLHAYEVEEHEKGRMEFVFTNFHTAARLVSMRSSEGVIEFRHDAGTRRLASIVDAQRHRIDFQYDAEGRIIRLVRQGHPSAGVTTLAAYAYDGQGRLICWTDAMGQQSAYEYDAAHRMTRKTDRRGYSYHYRYDEQGRCVHTYGDDGLYNVRLQYKVPGHCTVATYSDGGEWIFLFDQNGTITKIVDPYGGKHQRKVGPDGQVVEEVDSGGSVTRLLYTTAGAHYARLDPLGYFAPPLDVDPDPPDPLDHQLPDTPLEWEFGEVVARDLIDEPTVSDILLLEPPVQLAHKCREILFSSRQTRKQSLSESRPSHDAMGRLIEQVGKDGHLQRWQYDANGNVLSYHDRDGSVYRNEYFSWNLLLHEIDPLGHTTSYAYSPTEEITRIVDPGGTTSEYVYDQKDRLVEVLRHGRVREQYRYDKADNLIQKLDGEGNVLLSFEIGKDNLDSGEKLGSGETRHFEYDEHGRIIRATTDKHEIVCAYNDEVGRQLQDTRDGLGIAHEFSSEELIRTTVLGRFFINYQPGPTGELNIQDPTGGKHRLQSTPNGLLMKSLANGTMELCQYSSSGQCLLKVGQHRYGTIWNREYRYSAEGDLLSVTDSDRGTTHYRYDAAHRLVEELLPEEASRSYRYDAAGNLLEQPGLTGVVIGTGNKLRVANGADFTYDRRDHICKRVDASGCISYVYDSDDMLVRCEGSSGEWSADYDPLGRRIRKSWPGGQVQFYWDGDRLVAEVRNDGRLRIYIYVDEISLVPLMLVDYPSPDAPVESGRRYYVFTNQIGVPIRIEDDRGSEVWGATIDPYGQAHVDPTSSLDFALRSPGHYHDAEIGLYYNRFRYYSPELGRYLQVDPLGTAGSLNLYSYPANPLSNADIRGEHPETGPRSKGKKGKRPRKPKKEALKTGDVDSYKNQKKKRAGKHDRDHIPAFQSVLGKINEQRTNAKQRTLTPAQETKLKNNMTTGAVPRTTHKKGRTYGGKGGESRVREDGKDLRKATDADINHHVKNSKGQTQADMEAMRDKIHKSNEDLGLYDDPLPSSLWN